ncbi:MAG: nuclear transport factor 2 family protein [Novosphingobium sp.]|nr:nuclear transport factor 2 family protein [Novosphingobium sp.]
MNTTPGTADLASMMSPFDHVRAQLARQKWAVDRRDHERLPDIYTADCTLILKQKGETVLREVTGRDAVIAHIRSGWAGDTGWTPGSMVHHIGTILIEPAPDGLIRSNSYATYVHVVAPNRTEIHGYGKYHDLWAPEDGQWRLKRREVHLFGLELRNI